MYLTTCDSTLQAEILESKLRAEGIPCEKKYKGGSNAMEIIMGNSIGGAIELYVPAETLEDAKNIIVAIPILSDDFDEDDILSDEELERQALAAGCPEDKKTK